MLGKKNFENFTTVTRSEKIPKFTFIFNFSRSRSKLPQRRQIDDLLAWLDPKLVVSLDSGREDACREDF